MNIIYPGALVGTRRIWNQCTGAFVVKIKNGAGDAGIVAGQALQTPVLFTGGQALFDTFGAIDIGSASLASASTTDLGSLPQGIISVTGSATITSFGASAQIGTAKVLIFSAGITLTYNSGSLVLPTLANIVTQNNDTAIATFVGGWIVTQYQRSSGLALTQPTLVTSFDGRSGVVVPAADDYTVAQLTAAAVATAPSAGRVGETLTNTVSAVSVALANPTTIATVALTAGHWRCCAGIKLVNVGQAITSFQVSISLVTNTHGAQSALFGGFTIPANNPVGVPPPDLIVRVSAGTSVFLVVSYNGAGAGATADATLTCQRTD